MFSDDNTITEQWLNFPSGTYTCNERVQSWGTTTQAVKYSKYYSVELIFDSLEILSLNRWRWVNGPEFKSRILHFQIICFLNVKLLFLSNKIVFKFSAAMLKRRYNFFSN